MQKYRGFLAESAYRYKNTNGIHDTYAADIFKYLDGTPIKYGTKLFAPTTEDGGICKWRVIRVNNKDEKANGVIYSAIRDISHKDGAEFWYFHTAKSPLKRDQIIKSGDLVCYTAKNGTMTGPHLHLEGRQMDGRKHLNPKVCMSFMKGGPNGVLMGKKKVVSQQDNITQPTMPENVPVVKQETAQERVVSTTINYAAPIAAVIAAIGVILSFQFPDMPSHVVVAYTTVVGFIFNVIYDLFRFFYGK